MKLPDFIIIGAMKCATSTLHEQMASHESFFMSEPKEPCFFSDDVVYTKGIDWYMDLFLAAKSGQLKGESSTHYTKLPDYPKTIDRIVHHCPQLCKFIYVMRHPVDRLVSHYVHQWSQGVISCDINEAVHLFPELIHYSSYVMQIQPYLDRFGEDAVLPLFAERLRQNPQHELQVVFDFLGVKEKATWNDNLRSNVSSERIRPCVWRDALVEHPVLKKVRQTFVPKSLRTKIRSLWSMKKRPVLSVESQRYVEDLLKEDLCLLGDKLALQLTFDNFKQTITAQQNIQWKR